MTPRLRDALVAGGTSGLVLGQVSPGALLGALLAQATRLGVPCSPGVQAAPPALCGHTRLSSHPAGGEEILGL